MFSNSIDYCRSNLILMTMIGTVACLAAGCGQTGPEWRPVQGKVLIDGKNLTCGVIRFAPENGRQSMGAIDREGNFTLGSYQANDGAMVGTHRVAIVAREQINLRKAKWHAPKRYASYQTSGLTAKITEAGDPITIELTWGGRKGPFVEID